MILHIASSRDRQSAIRQHSAAAVGNRCTAQVCIAGNLPVAAGRVQRGGGADVQPGRPHPRAVCRKPAARRGDSYTGIARELRACQVDGTCLQPQFADGLQHAVVVGDVAADDFQHARAMDASAVAELPGSIQRRAGAIVLRDRTCVGDDAALQVQPGRDVDCAGVGQRAGGSDCQGGIARGLAGQRDIAGPIDPDVLAGMTVLQAQVTVHGQHQVALQRGHAAAAVDAGAALARQQVDLLRMHAAEVADIDGKARRRTGARLRRGLQGVVQHLVGASDDIEVAGPDLAFEHHAARDQVELLEAGGVQAVCTHLQLAGAHIETGEHAVAAATKLRLASDEAGATGVEKAATVAADAVGVGHDDVGALSGHFDGPAQRGRVGARYFIEDDARRQRTELQVAADPAALPALYRRGAVVQDQAVGVHIELVVLVVRDAGRTGRGDVDDGHAVLRSVHDGPPPGRSAYAGRDLRPRRHGQHGGLA